MAVERVLFGYTKENEEVYKYIITNNNEYSAHIITLGAALTSFYAKDNSENYRDVLLSFDDVDSLMSSSDYQGAIVGPYCNRIKNAGFEIDGIRYELEKNENTNSLHSNGEFSFVLWKAIVTDADSVEFSYISPDGLYGYPGNISVKVTYRLDDENKLHISYEACSDKKTFINLTNHAYFNLNGYGSGDILAHIAQFNSDFFVAVDKESIPTGELCNVTNTPFDFRAPKAIGKDIDSDFEQLKLTGGYDHTYCIADYDKSLRKCAEVYSAESGINLTVYTTLPGVQFYAGNFLSGKKGKENRQMTKRSGFCLETQFYPDTPNNSFFPSCLFDKGEKYISETVYEFSVKM